LHGISTGEVVHEWILRLTHCTGGKEKRDKLEMGKGRGWGLQRRIKDKDAGGKYGKSHTKSKIYRGRERVK
jgi:hypothetical protein